MGRQICKQMVLLAQQTDSNLIITARTLPEENYSTKILKRTGFKLSGVVWDKDDGNGWEWVFEK